MALYEQLASKDILRPLLPGFQSGKFEMTKDGKIKVNTKLGPHPAWIFAKEPRDRLCDKWHEIYFDFYNIIPKGCRNCWKVAYRPEHLSELFKIYEQQTIMNMPSKCGVETRGLTGGKGGYGSFWYAPLTDGLRKARLLQEEIRKKLVKRLSKDISKKITLKRGCTEMELATIRQFGVGSDRWDAMAEHYDEVEKRVEPHLIDDPDPFVEQPEIMRVHTQMFWIEWAREHGDLTYLNHSEATSWPPPLVNYVAGQVAMDFESTWKGA